MVEMLDSKPEYLLSSHTNGLDSLLGTSAAPYALARL